MLDEELKVTATVYSSCLSGIMKQMSDLVYIGFPGMASITLATFKSHVIDRAALLGDSHISKPEKEIIKNEMALVQKSLLEINEILQKAQKGPDQ